MCHLRSGAPSGIWFDMIMSVSNHGDFLNWRTWWYWWTVMIISHIGLLIVVNLDKKSKKYKNTRNCDPELLINIRHTPRESTRTTNNMNKHHYGDVQGFITRCWEWYTDKRHDICCPYKRNYSQTHGANSNMDCGLTLYLQWKSLREKGVLKLNLD